MLFLHNTMSRIALLSDIHANLPALEAVMKDIEQLQGDAVYCLGDIGGYNANPAECLEFVRGRQILSLIHICVTSLRDKNHESLACSCQ